MPATRAADLYGPPPESVTATKAAKKGDFDWITAEVRRQGDTKARLAEAGGRIVLDYGSHRVIAVVPTDLDLEQAGFENVEKHGDELAARDAARAEVQYP